MGLNSNYFLPAVRSGAISINLFSRNLEEFPEDLIKLSGTLEKLNIKKNCITDLPRQFSLLQKLTVLHLGHNKFEIFPESISRLRNLETLHMHDNCITTIPESCIGRLGKLKVLNLNSNKIETIPSDIGFLENLRFLSIEKNRLKTFPNEIAHCDSLEEIHASENELVSLPIGFGYLGKLKKCILRKNLLQDLPETFGKLTSLKCLDLAANDIRIFPTKFHQLRLRELYVECNQLIVERPVRSVQEDEIMTLKELASRTCLKELSQTNSLLRRTIKHYPALREMLSLASKCAMCNSLFLNTWLECVHFIDSRQIVGSPPVGPNANKSKIPVRALLCSYKCFNAQPSDGDSKQPVSYYGVAFPASAPPSANTIN
ncbi:leucine-rich repeat-containing protein 69-like [Symsagittifera roscoffensis]|uniref:leucine-rich repeat-containing protein 69-like n=1 Tax=Symsagittifera roscoffensis TaxID=84072 RepID=UPI00307B2832